MHSIKICYLAKMKITLLFILIFSQAAFASWVTTYQEVAQIIKADHVFHDSASLEQITVARDLNELEQAYGNEDLKLIYNSMTRDDILKNNENIRMLLESQLSEGDSLSSSEIRRIFRYTSNTTVVKREERYDRDEVIGFCFGRAFIAHHHSKIRNVDPLNIKKIWVVGDMKKWAHHVATILKGDKGWMAIDTYTGLLSIERWMQVMERDKKRGAEELMFFVTNATRFGHENNNFYNSIDLFNSPEENLIEYEDGKASSELKKNDFYKGYFIDFFRELARKIDNIKPFN